MTVKSKTCTKCGIEKSIDSFSPNFRYRDNLYSWCRDCFNKYHKETYQKIKNNLRKCELKRKYNLTLEDYDRLFSLQNGRCAICHNPESETFKGTIKRLSVDHSHLTGTVRGLLCGKCNRVLGLVDDRIDLLGFCIDYLNRQRS